MIIIEGFDNSGKSTLAKQLLKVLPDHRLSKLSKVGKPVDLQLNNVLIDMNKPKFSSRNTILDRFSLISELVYGEILRGDNHYGTVNNWKILLNYIRNNPFYLIYCRPSDSTLLFNMGKQMDGISRNAKKLIKRYDEVMQILEDIIIHSHYPRSMLTRYDWQSSQDPLNNFIKLYKEWSIYP